MSQIKDRVKKIRKHFKLSQDDFGAQIGIKKAAVSLIESGKSNLTEQNFIAICREYNIREEWLRNGSGDMFEKSDKFNLDEFVRSQCTDDSEVEILMEILKIYFNLDPDIRRRMVAHFKGSLPVSIASKIQSNNERIRSLMQKPPADMTDEEIKILTEQFNQELREEKEAAVESSASFESGGANVKMA